MERDVPALRLYSALSRRIWELMKRRRTASWKASAGGGGAMREVCGAFSGAAAVTSYYMSSGSPDGNSKGRTYQAIRRAAEIYEQEYGSIRCREILHGNTPKAFQCGMKVKDAVLAVNRVLEEMNDHGRT